MAVTTTPIALSATQRNFRVFLVAARIILGGIFIYAAYAKLHFNGAWHLRDYYFFFAMGIDSYRMLPIPVVEFMAKVLPWLELGLGLLLVIGVGVRWAGLAILGLLAMFMVALSHAALGGLEINCGCFGNNSVSPGKELILDSGLVILALAVTVGGFLSHRSGKLRS